MIVTVMKGYLRFVDQIPTKALMPESIKWAGKKVFYCLLPDYGSSAFRLPDA